MFYFKFLLFFTVFNLYTWAEKELNLKCGDAQCSEVIATCLVHGKYSPNSKDKLALNVGERVEVYGRDDKEKVFLGKVIGRDKKGFVSEHLCRLATKLNKGKELVSGTWLNDQSQEADESKVESENGTNVVPSNSSLGANETNSTTNSSDSDTNTNKSQLVDQKDPNLANSDTNLQKNEDEATKVTENVKSKVENESKETVSNPETTTSGNDTVQSESSNLQKNESEPLANETENVKKDEIENPETENMGNEENLESTKSDEDGVTVEDGSSELDTHQPTSTPVASSESTTPPPSPQGSNDSEEQKYSKEASSGKGDFNYQPTVPPFASSESTTHPPSPQGSNDSDDIKSSNEASSIGKVDTYQPPSTPVASSESAPPPSSPQGSNDSDNMKSSNEASSIGNVDTYQPTSTPVASSVSPTPPPSPQGSNDSKEMKSSKDASSGNVDTNYQPTLTPVASSVSPTPLPSPNYDSEEMNEKSSKQSIGKTIKKTEVPSNENSENPTNTTLDLHVGENITDIKAPSEPAPTRPTFYTGINGLNTLIKKTQGDQKILNDKQASYEKPASSLTGFNTAEQYQNVDNVTFDNDTIASDNLTAQSETNIKEEKMGESTSENHGNSGRSEDKEILNSDPNQNQVDQNANDQTPSLDTKGNFADDQNASEIESSTVSTQFSSESGITQTKTEYSDQLNSYTTSDPSSESGITQTENSVQSNSYPTSESPYIQNETDLKVEPPSLDAPLPTDSVPNEQNENYTPEMDLNDTTEEPSESWYSSILSYMPAFDSLLTSSPNAYSYEKSAEVYPEIPQAQEAVSEKQYGAENIPRYFDDEESCSADNSWISMKTTSWLVFTSVVILAFSLGYYYMENSKRDLELVIKNNDLASELFILQKERSVLEERLLDAEYNANAKSGEVQKEVVESLQNEISQIKEEKMKLVEREQSLVKKCAMLEANYSKLRQMFAENKQKGERSALIADIKKLKESSSSEIASLKEQLDVKTEEIKTLSVNLHKSNEAKTKLEDKLNSMMADEQMAIQNYQDSVAKLEQMIEESKGTVMKLEDEVGKLKKDCESLKIEKELAETALQKAHGLKSSESLSSWLDSKEIRISLASAEKEIEELKRIKEDFEKKQDSLSCNSQQLQNELQELNEKYEKAEKDKIEALTKLQVLSDYFNEKETQLQEELGLKEALWLQKQSDDHTIYEQMRTLREENQTFKSQNETLRKEIIDQETSYKKLIASAEEKADGYWVSLRQAERRLKETQIEASQLRNRLTAIETSEHNLTDDKMMKGIENGEMPPFGPTTSPPFMMYPGEFIPPPPLIPVTPSRPPPLGRISSPPLGDFTPPLPIPFDLYPPPSPPPPLQHLHRPQPREPNRKQKESQSSNHSSESTSEKPQRRTKR